MHLFLLYHRFCSTYTCTHYVYVCSLTCSRCSITPQGATSERHHTKTPALGKTADTKCNYMHCITHIVIILLLLSNTWSQLHPQCADVPVNGAVAGITIGGNVSYIESCGETKV